MAKKQQPGTTLPDRARLVIPTLGATGGSGRSTIAGLLACSLAPVGDTVVLDTAPRLASPWPAWPHQHGSGLASIPPDQPYTRAKAREASSRMPGPLGAWSVLTDHREWHNGALPLPSPPAAWYQLAAGGGWQVVVADTTHAVAHDLVTARAAGRVGQTAAWYSLPFAIPVLCALATGTGMGALQTAVKAASAEGLPLHRTIVALSVPGEGRMPPAVKAAATMLQSQVSAVVTVPYDSHVRNHGMAQAHRIGRRTSEAAAALASAVLNAAHRAWGDPLPPAPVPAALESPPDALVPARPHQPTSQEVLA